MENQIYHVVYLTTNLINNKIYIGVHSSWDIENDSYNMVRGGYGGSLEYINSLSNEKKLRGKKYI